MEGDLTINGVDTYTTYGISFEDGAISVLLTPPSLKSFIENESRLENGKALIVNSPVYDSRDMSLPFHLVAATSDEFLTKYAAFCELLKTGELNIWTKYIPGSTFRCVYQSCSQFAQYRLGIAKFTLKVTEPNPANRSLEE